MKKVVLVWGGWSCTMGYVHWAYVAERLEGQPVNTEMPGCELIGEHLYAAPNREEVTDPKSGKYGQKPAPYPKPLCRQWIEENDCELVGEVKMRVD